MRRLRKLYCVCKTLWKTLLSKCNPISNTQYKVQVFFHSVKFMGKDSLPLCSLGICVEWMQKYEASASHESVYRTDMGIGPCNYVPSCPYFKEWLFVKAPCYWCDNSHWNKHCLTFPTSSCARPPVTCIYVGFGMQWGILSLCAICRKRWENSTRKFQSLEYVTDFHRDISLLRAAANKSDSRDENSQKSTTW